MCLLSHFCQFAVRLPSGCPSLSKLILVIPYQIVAGSSDFDISNRNGSTLCETRTSCLGLESNEVGFTQGNRKFVREDNTTFVTPDFVQKVMFFRDLDQDFLLESSITDNLSDSVRDRTSGEPRSPRALICVVSVLGSLPGRGDVNRKFSLDVGPRSGRNG